MASRNDFKQFQRDAQKLIKGLPKLIGKMGLVQVSDNFRQQGAEDDAGVVVPWAPRKARGKPRGRTRKDGGRDRRYRLPKGRAILVQSGRLRRSPRIVSTTASSVTLGTDVPYAQPLQEGTTKMPARPFFAFGPRFKQNVIRQVAADITKLLK